MNKRGIFLLLLAVFLISFISAADENQTNLDKAYQCVRDKINDECSSLTSEQQAFAILALGDYKKCLDKFISNSKNQECWPKSNCNLKETSLALLAYDRLGKNTEKIESWLLNQTKTASDLVWYLQIEADGATKCSVAYGSSINNINIFDNKKVSAGAGTCLSLSESGYWLKIKSDSCLDNEYKISCDKDFKTTLLYKTQASPTIHVSQNLNSDAANGETSEKVTYKCFKQGTVCNYEGSLWAAMVLNFKGHSTSEFVPYLDAGVDENTGLFPESFLYLITDLDQYLQVITITNFKAKYWSSGTASKKFYDSALGFLSLQGKESTQTDAVREYLLTKGVQSSDGCWSNVRDTSFLLYAGWPLINSDEITECETDFDCDEGETCSSGGLCIGNATTSDTDCIAHGYFCEKTVPCLYDAEGQVLGNFEGCLSTQICCDKKVEKPTCLSQNGKICNFDEICDGTSIDSLDGICCKGNCKEEVTPAESECETRSSTYNCKSSCTDSEESNSYECDAGQVCCAPKETPDGGETPGIKWWIWALVALILIVLLLIIFRNKLGFLRFKSKSRTGPAPGQMRPPSFPPRPPMYPMRPRQFFPAGPRPQPQLKPNIKDKEFEETLKKLKDLNK